jgi:hypothetical protein
MRKLNREGNDMRLPSKPFFEKHIEKYLGFCIAIFSTLYIHRNIIFSKAMPGDFFDARATLVWYEHWHSFFKGNVQLRDVSVFFPAKNVLAGSDANLIQGVFYSIFRFLGFQESSSLKMTVITISFIGFLGIARLSFLLFRDWALSVSAILIAVTSYQLIAQAGHLQTWLYLSVAWVIVGLIYLYRDEEGLFATTLIFLGIPILALSTWYCIIALLFLGGLYLIIYGIIEPSLLKTSIFRILRNLKRVGESTRYIVPIFSLSLALMVLFTYIYFQKLNDKHFGTWSEVSFYSPRLFDLVNASVGAQGWQAEIYAFTRLGTNPTFERSMGLSFSVLILLFISSLFLLTNRMQISNTIKALSLTAIAIFVLPLTDDRGQSFWYFINKLPVMNSVRAPGRLWFFASITISWIAIWIIWKATRSEKKSKFSKTIFVSIIAILSFMQLRTPLAAWDESDLLSPFGKQAQQLIIENKCDVFYLGDEPNLGLYESISRQIDGMIIATLNNRKTINGYTSNPPIGWPQRPVWGLVQVEDIRPWINQNSNYFDQKICYLDETGVIAIDASANNE